MQIWFNILSILVRNPQIPFLLEYIPYMGHSATKPDKVNVGITKNFRDQNLV
jgi:hypothetical protein